jgi:SAM-dependent methyltransferase
MLLDAGCGHGYGSAYLAERGSMDVLGIDSDEDAIAFAKANYQGNNVMFLSSDVAMLPLKSEVFDSVVSFEVIEHLDDPQIFLSEVRRVLKVGGVLVLSTPNRDVTRKLDREGRPVNPFHVHEFSRDELLTLLQQFFVVEEAYLQSTPFAYRTLAKHYNYLDSCKVPLVVRRFVPSRIKDEWLKRKGCLLESTRGMWREFKILPTKGLPDSTILFPTQLYRCRKESVRGNTN